MQEINYTVAFLTGIISFFSPCILPLIPVYFSYFLSLSAKDIFNRRISIVVNSILFSAGFLIVFAGLGATATLFGRFLITNRTLFQNISAFILIFMGLFIAGFIPIKFLQIEKRIWVNYKVSYFSSFLFGSAFAFSWTPCIGPIVASMLVLASNMKTLSEAGIFMALYALGLSLPLIITAFFGDYAVKFFRKRRKYSILVPKISGAVITLLGILFLTNSYKPVAGYLYSLYDILGLPTI